jgi:5-methylcytosine-specific restriction endonuclease McrA
MDISQEKTCSICGITKPLTAFNKKRRSQDGHRPECRDCQKQANAAYKPVQRARYQENKEEWSLRNAQYHQENREAILARHKRNRLKNPAKYKAEGAAYRAAHPVYFREAAKRRRAQQAGAPVNDLSPAQWEEIQVAQKHRCYYCQKRCKGRLTQDHILAISKGGSHTVHNVIAACSSCNNRKHKNAPPIPVQPFLLTVAPVRKHYNPRKT